MKTTKWICIAALLLAWSITALAQTGIKEHSGDCAATLDALREKHALQIFLKSVEQEIVSAADAMPADKYGYAPTEGEFKSVRTFGQQVKHLAATNHILAAAALGEDPPADAGDEAGPESVRTKAEILRISEWVVRASWESDRRDRRSERAGQGIPHFSFAS
jgi:hypothetical protein